MKTLIVDDERPARERLRTLLRRHEDVEILAECGSGESAVAAIRGSEPDVVFLDIRMPGMDGFDVLDALGPARGFDIVFLTAHDEHAVRAFETRAADFLLKPVGAKRLREALDRVRERMRGVRPVRRLVVRDGGEVTFVPVAEIDRVESAGNYAVLHTARGTHIVRETMSALEEFLSPDGFVRVSRLAILNVTRIRKIRPDGAASVAILADGTEIPVKCAVRDLTSRL